MPQLQHVHAICKAFDRRRVRPAKLLIGIGLGRKTSQFFGRKVGQKLAQDVRGTAFVVHAQKRLHLICR